MQIKYYQITKLQGDTPELNSLIDDMKITAMTNAELSKIKSLIIEFMVTLRPDLHVIAESGYVDRTYRDSYYDYYSTKRSQYFRNCIRLSFFDAAYDHNINLDDIDSIKNNYLGFLILRPLAKCIGNNVISPSAKVAAFSNIRLCNVEVDTSCLGVKLKAKGFPHASQDSETMTCAQTTIWSILEYYGNKYVMYKPTTPTEIEHILEPFSYERQLPSSGLTYNQISVALRTLGFAPKIYKCGSSAQDIEIFRQLLSCYIESGIPLAIALTGPHIGHAVVCVGTEKFDRMEVFNHLVRYDTVDDSGNTISKNLYSWNKAVAQQKFVFNDDNFPNYQIAKLEKPCEHYVNKGYAPWSNVNVSQFIAPLYSKVYMDADTAIELSKQIILKVIPEGNNNVVRTFLTSSRTYREHIVASKLLQTKEKMALLQIEMPKFVWVTELSSRDEFINGQISTLLLLDATGSKKANLSRNTILLLSDRYFYWYDSASRSMKGTLTTLPQSIEAFSGNLK